MLDYFYSLVETIRKERPPGDFVYFITMGSLIPELEDEENQ